MEKSFKAQPSEKSAASNGMESWSLEGPHARLKELGFVFEVMKEFIKGFRTLHFVGPCVTVFGSARFKEDHQYYMLARQMGSALANLGFTVMTGGGPGIMEAANRGAKDAGGASVGCNIKLQMEQEPNPYLDRWITLDHFFVRKFLLLKYSYSFVVMPGGFGTMDELFETITLIQTKKLENFPVILMGKSYWQTMMTFIEQMLTISTISSEDLKLLLVTDDVEEAIAHINKFASGNVSLKKTLKIKPIPVLGESKVLE
ncbi:MAG: TIGR00730 family Rossman fold protein [Chitinophagales bacterium]|nr:TIGR00730 family Rossman fold protein [Chitinophagales bacterium]